MPTRLTDHNRDVVLHTLSTSLSHLLHLIFLHTLHLHPVIHRFPLFELMQEVIPSIVQDPLVKERRKFLYVHLYRGDNYPKTSASYSLSRTFLPQIHYMNQFQNLHRLLAIAAPAALFPDHFFLLPSTLRRLSYCLLHYFPLSRASRHRPRSLLPFPIPIRGWHRSD